jgi:hypothetical protein
VQGLTPVAPNSEPVVSDERWRAICAAADPRKHRPLEHARGELEWVLSQYPGLRRDTATLRRGLDNWERINELASELHPLLVEEWRQGRVHHVPMIDDVFKHYLLRHAAPLSRSLALRVSARKGWGDTDRDGLILALLDIWLNSFRDAKLTTSSGRTGGPCVYFVRTAMGFVVPADEVPKVGTMRRIVQQLGRGEPLGDYRYDPVTGAKGPWRKGPLW